VEPVHSEPGLLFDSEDGSGKFLRNNGLSLSLKYIVLQPRRPYFSDELYAFVNFMYVQHHLGGKKNSFYSMV
jgi:hypothetical protein